VTLLLPSIRLASEPNPFPDIVGIIQELRFNP